VDEKNNRQQCLYSRRYRIYQVDMESSSESNEDVLDQVGQM